FATVDAIVPVPLHPKRQHQRGYNQAEAFGRGLAQALNIPQWPRVLQRLTHGISQTKMTQQQRLQNTDSVYVLAEENQISGQHILLVDDVLTTGATLEACAQELLRAAEVKVSLATIAIAE
ncbi:MAG: phosphoribosyltransferase family protein, partial [Bacteroidota bacterium]